MKTLFVGLKHDYGDPTRGPSFEWHNFVDTLRRVSDDLLVFDPHAVGRTRGRRNANRLLRETVDRERPDLMFTVLFQEELDRATVSSISSETETTTFNWFCDDHWRFDDYSSAWAPAFDWVATTAKEAPAKYGRIGYRHAIKSQWACNPFLYRPLGLPLVHDASFVGQPHGNRRDTLARLAAAGVPVAAWGQGWERGRLSQEEMIRVFNQSRINLNLANASSVGGGPAGPAWLGKLAGKVPRWVVPGPVRRLAGSLLQRRTRTDTAPEPSRYRQQIKGRNFEVPGCGGFLLTEEAEDLAAYYAPEREVACYAAEAELPGRIRYFLRNADERAAIAQAGYERTVREHTYFHRYEDLFSRMGLPCPKAADVLREARPPCVIREVA